MNSRTFLGILFILVVLLAGAIVYPGALAKPYSGGTNYYAIAHESSEAFNESMEYDSVDKDDRIAVSDFSEEQRRAFEEAKKGESSRSGWKSIGEPAVCNPSLLVCDKYEEFPHPANGESTDGGYFVVEDSTGDQFIIKIGTAGADWNMDSIETHITKLVVLVPYAIFFAYRGVRAGWGDHVSYPTTLSVGYGAGLVTVVFAYPYFLMFTRISLPSWHLPALAVITWAVILTEIWRSRGETGVVSTQG